jgi:hypothetical protein
VVAIAGVVDAVDVLSSEAACGSALAASVRIVLVFAAFHFRLLRHV